MRRTIHAFTRYDRLGASSRVRVLQYIPALERAGFKVEVHPLFGEGDLRLLYEEGRRSPQRLGCALVHRLAATLSTAKGEIVWLQQEIFPYLPYVIEAAFLAGRKLVLDFDDAHHLYYKTAPLKRLACGRKVEHLMARADAVVVGSPFMAEAARSAGARNIHLVYSAVDTSAYDLRVQAPVRFTVGWIGTPMTAAQSFGVFHDPLKRFLAETGADALFIGMAEGQFPDLPGKRLAWSEAVEREMLPRISVGLCPLEDNSWTRGKSGYKIIQYMAAGKPALTSPVGIAADIVEDGTTGFHCRTPSDWYQRLMQLFRDPAQLDALGAASRKRAESRYDTTIAAAQLRRIFEDCSGG